ncbi:MAG: AMP-binding protein [Bacteroidetes bacterium]|nr:AMP-binding protein [Bacteroidota bacterium]MCL2301851.1 AMP-binding protein [Lentimicrobiaceae bacterium]
MVKNLPKTAIVYRDVKYSYTQLLQYAEKYCQTFLLNGKTPEKVMIFADNAPEYFFATYGALKCDASVVPVDVQSTAKEISYIMEECRPEIIFVSEYYKEKIADIANVIPDYSYTIFSPSDIDISNIEEMPINEISMRQDDHVAAIIYTSGTTGSPKGVMLSYKNFWYNLDAVANQIPIFNSNTNIMVLLPLHHSFPFAGTMLAPLYAGGTCWITDGMKPESILQTLSDGKITLIIGVPRLYETLAKSIMSKINASFAAKTLYKLASLLKSRAFSKTIFKAVHQKFGGHIQHLVSGGAALPTDIAKIYRTLGFYILEGYGMTECAPMITFTRPGEWRYGYAGRLLPGCEMKIAENDEILVRGNNVMQGYYKKPEETAAIIRDGWLHTGDTGTIDEIGVKITGRIKEIIVTSNGKNINPVEIEFELMKKSVFMKEIAAFLHNDQLHLLIYPEMSAIRLHSDGDFDELLKNEIAEYNKNAMHYKRIQQFHVVSEELPKTRLGKIQRFKLEEFIQKKEQRPDEEIGHFSSTYKILKQFIDKELNVKAHSGDHFEIDLAMDSLNKLALLAFIENAFSISMKAQELDELCCLEKLSQSIEKQAPEYNENEMSWKDILQTEKPTLKLPRSGFIHWFTANFIKLTFHLYFCLRGKGKENIPNQPVIFVANHRSGLDGVFVTARLPWKRVKNTFFFAKDKHFQSVFARFMAPRNNIILMNINTNLRESIVQMSEVLRQGKNVIIFPEGTRAKDKKMKDFKDMFAILSQELNIPIVPVAISGSERAAFRFKRIPRPFVRIFVEFLPPVYPNANENVQELKEKVQLIIESVLTQDSSLRSE